MGTQFFWFYDIALIATFAGIAYKCARQGFAAAAAGFIGLIPAFVVALILSAGAAEYVFNEWVAPVVSEKISVLYHKEETSENPEALEETGDLAEDLEEADALEAEEVIEEVFDDEFKLAKAFSELKNIDRTKIKLAGEYISNDYTASAKITGLDDINSSAVIAFDFDKIDLSETGIEEADLSFFGFNPETDFSALNLGKVNVGVYELDEADLGTIILAKTISSEMFKNKFELYGRLSNAAAKAVPGFAVISETDGGLDPVAKLLIIAIKSDTFNLETAVIDYMVRPVAVVPIRALIFSIIFAIINILFAIVVKALKLLNNVPVVGNANFVLGLALGILEAALSVFLICIGVRALIAVTGDSIMFLNTMTIDETNVFKYVYYLDFLKF